MPQFTSRRISIRGFIARSFRRASNRIRGMVVDLEAGARKRRNGFELDRRAVDTLSVASTLVAGDEEGEAGEEAGSLHMDLGRSEDFWRRFPESRGQPVTMDMYVWYTLFCEPERGRYLR